MFVKEFPLETKSAVMTEGPFAVGDPFVPEYIYDALRKHKGFYSVRGKQEDAEEFLGFLLDGLHEELVQTCADQDQAITPPDEANGVITTTLKPEPDQNGWLEVGKKKLLSVTRNLQTQVSPITQIFGGQLRSVVRRSGNKDSVMIEPFHSLQLDLNPDDVVDIHSALIHLCSPEVLESKTTKQLLIEHLPPILVLHLKRFVFTENGALKLHKPVNYESRFQLPFECFSPSVPSDVSASRYKLFGGASHSLMISFT